MSVPYIVGSAIKNPNNFYGFHDLIVNVYDIIGGRQTQSVSLLGVGKSGKTSLLHHVADHSILKQYVTRPNDYVMFYLDFSTCKTPIEFYQKVYKALLTQLSNTSTQDPILSAHSSPTADELASLLCFFTGRRVILLLDEFDHLQVGTFNQDFLSQLRALASAPDSELAYITASYHSLEQLEASVGRASTSPFYSIFHPKRLYLSGLSKIEAKDLIYTPAAQVGVTFTDDEVESIQGMAGTLPFLLQMSACKWFLTNRDGQSITQEEIQRELTSEANPSFESWWQNLEEENRVLLGKIAKKGGFYINSFQRPVLKEVLRFLKNYGLVIEEGDAVRINGLVLTTWICERIARHLDEPAMTSLAKIMDTETVEVKKDGKSLRNQVFFSYSHKDKKWLEKFQTWLKPIMRSDMLWDDTKIVSGARWKDEIQKSLESAKVGVLLVSQHFLASDFIQKHELPPLLKAAEEEGLTVLWIPITHSTYEHTDIAQFQAVHDPARPLNSLKGANLEKALTVICNKIKAAAERV